MFRFLRQRAALSASLATTVASLVEFASAATPLGTAAVSTAPAAAKSAQPPSSSDSEHRPVFVVIMPVSTSIPTLRVVGDFGQPLPRQTLTDLISLGRYDR